MSGGPSTRVQRAIAVATKAVRIISGSGNPAQDPVSYAPLPFRRGRHFGDLVSRVGLPPEREGKIPSFPAPLDLYSNAFVGLVVAEPAFRRARKQFAVQSDQDIALFQSHFACAAFAIHGCNGNGS